MKKLSFPLTLALSICFLLPRICIAAGNDNPTGVTGDYNGVITTGGSYDPYTGNAKRIVEDITVAGSVGAYPLKWTRILNTRYGQGAAPFGQGGTWQHGYRWGLWLRPLRTGFEDPPYEGPDGTVSYPDGRTMDLRSSQQTVYVQAYYGQRLGDRIQHMGGGNYDLILADGGRVKFEHPAGSTSTYDLLATRILDPYGQTTILTRDSAKRITRVTEPGGRYLQINYTTYSYYRSYPAPGQWHYVDVISSVQAFAKAGVLTETVSYDYTWEDVPPLEYYNLTQVNYDDGTKATYTYYPSNLGNGISGRMRTCDDVRFAGAMSKIDYEYLAYADIGGPPDVGQVKREKNLTTHQVVSEVIYPPWQYSPPPGDLTAYQRTEKRGDGSTRFFQYSNDGLAELASYTDFKGQPSQIEQLLCGCGTLFTDARANQTLTSKEGVIGAVTAVTRGNDPPVRYAYSDVNNPHYLASRTDERGYITAYTRDANKRVTQIDYPDPGYETFTYNVLGQVLTHRLTSGGTETFEYDNGANNRGLKTRHWAPATPSDPTPAPTVYLYYLTGPHTDRLLSVTDPRGNTTSYQYNPRGLVTRVTHPDAYYTQSAYNPTGTLAWTADENHPGAATDPNQRTSYTYDEYKRVLTVTNPMGETRTNSYALDVNWAQPLLHTTNCLKYTISPMGKNVVYDYDANFRKIDQVVALGTADEAWTLFEYDAVGNLTKTTDPRFYETRFGYDARNRKIWMDDPIASDRNSSGHTMNWAYDSVGNKTRETRANGAFRSWDYDSMNRLWHAYDWRTNDPPASYQTTTYTRDAAGNAYNITDTKGAIYKYTYDALNRKTDAIYPADAALVARTEHFWYDSAGNLALYKNPANQYKHLNYTDSYDARNRLRHSGWSLSQTSTVVDRTVGPEIRTNYDTASRMTQITTDGGVTTVAFGYDEANRKIWEDQTLSGYPTRRVNTPRDDDGNRTSLSAPASYSVTYAYTGRNQLAAVNGFASFTYDKSGNMTNRLGQWLYTNGADFYYDPLNRVTEIEHRNATAVVADSHYQYDTVGREVATWRDEDGNKGERFSYNQTDHLTSALYMATNVWTTTPTAPQTQRQYTYDLDQLNWSSMTDNGVVKPFVNSAINQYTSVNGQAVSYDNNFNLTSFAGNTFTYNAQNQLVGGSMQATYDGLGRCVKRTVAGVTRLFAYDDWKLILEWDGAGTWAAWNVYGAGPDEILARFDSGGRHLIYKQDQHGNVVAVLGGTGLLAEKYRYDAFGRPTIMNSSGSVLGQTAIANRFLFTGREWIAEFGIYDYRHRFYNPELGRFLQTDSLGLQTEGVKLTAGEKALFSPGGSAPEAFDSSEMNLYRYCGDDPVNKSDPLGLKTGDWWDFPANFTRAREIAAEESAKHIGTDNIEDARRHSEWMRRTALETNWLTAYLAGTGHELDNILRQRKPESTAMDLNNNAAGREAGLKKKPVDEDKLRTLPKSGMPYKDAEVYKPKKKDDQKEK